MQTRRQDPKSREFRQEAFSSSSEFERGALGNLVAARCHKIIDREEIAMLWWLQQISWREGGMELFVDRLLAANQGRIGTPALLKLGAELGRIYTAKEVRTVRAQMSSQAAAAFPLRGDDPSDCDPEGLLDQDSRGFRARYDQAPLSYPASELKKKCQLSTPELSCLLKRALVNPESPSLRDGFWNFPALWDACCEAQRKERAEVAAGIVETAVAKQIFEELDFALETRSFVLIEGREGIGKSEAASSWCAQRPGRAIYVRLEYGTDETTLYRSIARKVGTACSYTRKAVEIRSRVQDALQAGHVMLVLDEAHFLFPQNERAWAIPKRLDWLRTTLIDFGVPIALVSTPQFFSKQCDRYRKIGWNANQIQRRLARTTLLPDTLSTDDVLAVVRRHFPSVTVPKAKRIAGASLLTLGYLSTIVHIRKRVDFLCSRKPSATEDDIVEAVLKEVIPASESTLPSAAKASAAPVQPRCIRAAESFSRPEIVPIYGSRKQPEMSPVQG